jgi:hypothetical protein
VNADAGILSIKASGGTAVAGKNNFTLSPGTCLAYLLLKLDWDKNKSQIVDVDADEWSIN